MSKMTPPLPALTNGYAMARFNALRHGILSRHTVLPWEDAEEYRMLLAALAAEHAPQGPTEKHLVRNWPASYGASVGCGLPRLPFIARA